MIKAELSQRRENLKTDGWLENEYSATRWKNVGENFFFVKAGFPSRTRIVQAQIRTIQVSDPKFLQIDKKLVHIKTAIMDLIKRYQKLEKDFMMSQFDLNESESQYEINKFDIAVEIIEDKLKLCDLDLKVLEVERKKTGPTNRLTPGANKDSDSARKIGDLERRLREATDELYKQREVQKEMETTYKESKQRRVEHMRVLLEELRKYLNHIDTFNGGETRRRASLEKIT